MYLELISVVLCILLVAHGLFIIGLMRVQPSIWHDVRKPEEEARVLFLVAALPP